MLDGGKAQKKSGEELASPSSRNVLGMGWEPGPASRTRPGPLRHGFGAPHPHSQLRRFRQADMLGCILKRGEPE